MVNVGHVTLGASIKGADKVSDQLAQMSQSMSQVKQSSSEVDEGITSAEESTAGLVETIKGYTTSSQIARKATSFFDDSISLLTGRAGIASTVMQGLTFIQQGYTAATTAATFATTGLSKALTGLGSVATRLVAGLGTLGTIAGTIVSAISATTAAAIGAGLALGLFVTELTNLTDFTDLSSQSILSFGEAFKKSIFGFVGDAVAQYKDYVSDIITVTKNIPDFINLGRAAIADQIPGVSGKVNEQLEKMSSDGVTTNVSSTGVSTKTENISNTEQKQVKQEVTNNNTINLDGQFDPEQLDRRQLETLADLISEESGDDVTRRSL